MILGLKCKTSPSKGKDRNVGSWQRDKAAHAALEVNVSGRRWKSSAWIALSSENHGCCMGGTNETSLALRDHVSREQIQKVDARRIVAKIGHLFQEEGTGYMTPGIRIKVKSMKA